MKEDNQEGDCIPKRKLHSSNPFSQDGTMMWRLLKSLRVSLENKSQESMWTTSETESDGKMLNHLAKYQNNYIYYKRVEGFYSQPFAVITYFSLPLFFSTMTRKRNNRRIMGEDGWTYRCSICKQHLPPTEFHKDNSKPPFFLSYNCKQCRKEINKRPPDPETALEKDRILKALGYNLNEDIHQQFLERMEKRKRDL